jgi:predicted DNA-binding transcriptional regulator AlpA
MSNPRHVTPAEPREGPDQAAESSTPPGMDRLAYRLDDLAQVLGISRRTLERERSAGRFPPPDRLVGKMPIWSVATIRRWVEGGGR